jgi:IclR family pca regulon transcriptional regulator
VGSTSPAHATALGKVLLAGRGDEWLDGYLTGVARRPAGDELRDDIVRTRDQGWLLADEGASGAMRSIAAPIRIDQQVVAAIAVTTHAARTEDAALVEAIRAAVVDAADRTTRELATPS